MTPTAFAPPDASAKPLALVDKDGLATWRSGLSPEAAAWVEAQGFTGGFGASIVFPDRDGRPASAAVGLGTARDRSRNRYALAKARSALPDGAWTLEHSLSADNLAAECLGWLLEGYRFARYRDVPSPKAMLVAPAGIDAPRIEALAAAEVLTRDLINTPANDMGPADLAQAAQALAQRHGASFGQIVGDALLDQDFPLIHAVGAASPRAPRLIDLRWGETGPRVTLVGKGVCFDTGGLNLKPGESMGLMKKDMGGAATVLGLTDLILTLGMQIRLRVLIPAVENAVSGASFRPGDILRSRKGLTVEVNNTDAEGRLVLADALAFADEEAPDLIVSMATLTGAARVAVGPDIAPFFTDSDQIAAALSEAGQAARDPVWRLPFWDPYETMIEPGIADLDNAPRGGFAGAITAALFLRRFVAATPRYVHFDIYGWQPTSAPGRPKGGVGQGARAIFGALPGIIPEVVPR